MEILEESKLIIEHDFHMFQMMHFRSQLIYIFKHANKS